MKALGRHLLLELFDCDAAALSSLPVVKTSVLEAATRAHATIVNQVFHQFSPYGVSGVVVIAESHVAIHTWPEYRFAAVDIFSCGDVLQPQLAADYLAQCLGAGRTSVVELERGLVDRDTAKDAMPDHRHADRRSLAFGVDAARITPVLRQRLPAPNR